jgi:murein DD-endopeptidase MepM/ murein hydrolase activator NlpD
VCTVFFSSVFAQSADELQTKIDQRANDIQALEKEIASYQKQLNEIGTQVSSLSATIKSLQLTQKKLEADIKVTENKIAEKNLLIKQLGGQISDKEETITEDRRIITRSYQSVNEIGDKSLPELLLGEKSLSTAWNSMDSIAAVQNALIDRIASLQSAKTNLETNKKATEKAKTELVTLSKQLNDQKKVVLETVAEQNYLLKETKQSESQYQRVLKERQALKESFEREVALLEQALTSVDSSSIPRVGSGVLSWPIDAPSITQYFGNTTFSTANPQVYKGSSGEHNGIDLRASVGTPIKSAAGGVVSHTFATASRIKCGYGNWVSVEHPNGLTTLYAHMSLNTVKIGDTIARGQIVGYSGNTGFTTGPHLHFGVYATDGFQVANSRSCPGIMIPYAPLNAYLNPLSYL